ncbi:MAG: hypothetical protein HY334_01575 [Armatimonadetes bacterium]|nr:hypothetical protein [Armatimonadota bacterium]
MDAVVERMLALDVPAREVGDLATQDLLMEVIHDLEKRPWMFRSQQGDLADRDTMNAIRR